MCTWLLTSLVSFLPLCVRRLPDSQVRVKFTRARKVQPVSSPRRALQGLSLLLERGSAQFLSAPTKACLCIWLRLRLPLPLAECTEGF